MVKKISMSIENILRFLFLHDFMFLPLSLCTQLLVEILYALFELFCASFFSFAAWCAPFRQQKRAKATKTTERIEHCCSARTKLYCLFQFFVVFTMFVFVLHRYSEIAWVLDRVFVISLCSLRLCFPLKSSCFFFFCFSCLLAFLFRQLLIVSLQFIFSWHSL